MNNLRINLKIKTVPGGPKRKVPKINFPMTKVKRKFCQKMFYTF